MNRDWKARIGKVGFIQALSLLVLGGLLPIYSGAQGSEDLTALAIAARDQGNPENALSLWNKAVDFSPTDGFLLNQRGWAYLALGRTREAKKSFAKALELSTDSAGLAEANFGIGMAEFMDSELKSAAKSFQSVCAQSPYLYPAGSAWMAKIALQMGKSHVALLYLRQSVDQDPFRPAAADALAALYEREHSLREAWQTYRMARTLNPVDAEAAKGIERVEKSLQESADKLSATRRFSAPLLQKPFAPPPSPVLRVGLFADSEGALAQVRRFLFVSGAAFKLFQDGKEAAQGRANETWEASWDLESRILELRDAGRKLRYAGRNVVRIEPQAPGAGVLMREIALKDPQGRDLSDREFRGTLELRPAASGFFLINELGSEEYLYSEVSALSPADAPAEELKAQAVVSRTALESLRRRFSRPDLATDLCDSTYCQAYGGISQERSEATAAVVATAGQRLYLSSGSVSAQQQAHCAGLTEEGIVDASTGTALPRSSEELERFLHGDPPKENFCNASPFAPSHWARWLRVLEAREMEEALSDHGRLGRIQRVRVVSRSSAGRATALEFAGSDGRIALQGEDALRDFLPRLGLRSALFSIQPLYRGRDLTYALVWGAGSGDGHGMCIAGAMGQAYAGREYKEILRHYFPGADIR